jgi:RNA polymerase sigma-70 factor (sigma-E family)
MVVAGDVSTERARQLVQEVMELRPRDEVTAVPGEQLVVSPSTSRVEMAADFTGWVAEHQRSLLAFAQLVAGDAPTGEDLLQAALARAYLKWPKIGAAGEHPVGYVRRIIVNENASMWRRAWKRRERSMPSPPESEMVEVTPDTTWALVQALPARQRAAIALRFYADLTVAETADAMGCSQGAVKTHTSRAIAKLRGALTEGDES